MSESQSSTTTGWFINALINSLRKATGPSFAQVIDQTPWRKYKNNPPANSMSEVVSVGDEISRFHAKVYEALGPDSYKAFALLAAQEISAQMVAALAPDAAAATAQQQGVTRLATVMSLLSNFWQSTNPGASVTMLDNGAVVALPYCVECRYITSAQPVCYFISDSIRLNSSRLSGLQLSIAEEQCHAVSRGSTCRLIITLR